MKPRTILAWSNFFAFAPFYLTSYIITPYLATFMPSASTGLPVSLGAIVTLVLFAFVPQLIARYGPQRLAITFAGLTGIILLLLSQNPRPLEAIALVALACGFFPLIVYQLDPLLEACVADESTTGRVRTAFITAGNTALVLSPVAIGILLDHSDRYGIVFLVSALAAIPFIFLMLVRTLPNVRPLRIRHFGEAFVSIYLDRDLRAIACANIVLQSLFQLTPLYVSLYLHTVLHMPWSEMGWILAIALVPYLLVEYPAGWLADTKLGDKMLLALGFVIAGLSFASLGFITVSTPIAVILFILVMLRIGGALIESMTESHFFRRVTAENADTVSVFRTMRPIGALIAPIVGTLLLSVASFGSFFAVCGFTILIAGLGSALAIRGR